MMYTVPLKSNQKSSFFLQRVKSEGYRKQMALDRSQKMVLQEFHKHVFYSREDQVVLWKYQCFIIKEPTLFQQCMMVCITQAPVGFLRALRFSGKIPLYIQEHLIWAAATTYTHVCLYNLLNCFSLIKYPEHQPNSKSV